MWLAIRVMSLPCRGCSVSLSVTIQGPGPPANQKPLGVGWVSWRSGPRAARRRRRSPSSRCSSHRRPSCRRRPSPNTAAYLSWKGWVYLSSKKWGSPSSDSCWGPGSNCRRCPSSRRWKYLRSSSCWHRSSNSRSCQPSGPGQRRCLGVCTARRSLAWWRASIAGCSPVGCSGVGGPLDACAPVAERERLSCPPPVLRRTGYRRRSTNSTSAGSGGSGSHPRSAPGWPACCRSVIG